MRAECVGERMRAGKCVSGQTELTPLPIKNPRPKPALLFPVPADRPRDLLRINLEFAFGHPN